MDRNTLKCLKTGVKFSNDLSSGNKRNKQCMVGDLQIDMLSDKLYITGIPQNNWIVLHCIDQPDIIIDDNNIVYHIDGKANFYWVELPLKYIKSINSDFVTFLTQYYFEKDVSWVNDIVMF